jgi:hypothetical protein
MTRATIDDLGELHRLLTLALVDKLNGNVNVSAEWADVARALLKQEGTEAPTEAERAALRRLYGLLVDRLVDALQQASPSASVLAVVRHFLQDQGVTKDLPGGIAQAQALQALTAADLPFKTN